MVEALPKTLFIGNGLNQTLSESYSWKELVKEIGGEEAGFKNEEAVPAPILFEVIASNNNRMVGRRGEDTYLSTKKKVRELVANMTIERDCIHYRLSNLSFSNVITTNYDLCIERALDTGNGESNYEKIETKSVKYLFEPTSKVNGIYIYHAHGIQDREQSICLGYEHYCGYIQHMREKLLSSAKSGHDSTSRLLQLVCGEKKDVYDWPELFFTSDIDIIGFGLDFSEI